jgi:tetratricopeptide (TPR) repeat protein
MGLFHSKNKTEEGLRTSLAYFKKAIEIDPTYASAYSQLAYTYNELGNFDILPSNEVYPKAKAAAEKALELEENLGEAHASLAWAKMVYDWDWAAAERGYKKALKLNPNSSLILEWYAEYLLFQGRFDEAVAKAKQSEELNPLSLSTLRHLGEIFLMTGQYDKAIEQLQKTLDMAPDYFVAHRDLARAYATKGMESAAIEEIQIMLSQLGDNQSDNMYRAFLHLMLGLVSGRTNEVQKMLDELEKSLKLSPGVLINLAGVYATIGQKDKAFEFLEKAYEERDHSLIWIKVDPAFDGLRPDPRFTSLLNRIGLKN